MQNPGSITFLALFAIATVLIYLSVRRSWLSITSSAGLGAVACTVSFVLFSLSQGNLFIQALIVGVLLGLLFTGMTVAMAAFFKNNDAARAENQPTPPSAE